MDNVAAMSIETEEELEGLRRAGQVVALVLRELRRRVQPGVATGEDDPTLLHAGLVITIEPILGAGGQGIRPGGDGWTISTADGAPAAHVEHTVVVTEDRPLVLTR
jgi:methionine aminopeptidase